VTRIDSGNTSSACHGLQSHLKYTCIDHRHLNDIYHFNHITSFISLSSDGISVEDVMIGLIEEYGVEAFPFTRKQIEELRSIGDAKLQGGQLLALEGRNYVLSRDTRNVI